MASGAGIQSFTGPWSSWIAKCIGVSGMRDLSVTVNRARPSTYQVMRSGSQSTAKVCHCEKSPGMLPPTIVSPPSPECSTKCALSRCSAGTSTMSISPSISFSESGHSRIAEPKPRPWSVRARNSQRP